MNRIIKPTRRLFLAGAAAGLIASPSIIRAGTMPLLGTGKAAAGGAFTPANLSGLLGWWKADAGVFNDAGVTLATNGQSVQQWNDQSGHGNHFVQATAGNKPTFTTNSLNSLPAVIGGATPLMSVASFALGGSTVSTYVVVNNPSHTGRILDYSISGVDFGATGFILPHCNVSTAYQAYQNGIVSNTGAVGAGYFQVYSVCDGTNITVYVGGVAQTPAAVTPAFAASGQLNIFAEATASSFFIGGGIAEIVVTSNASGADRTNMNAYLLAKWGV